MSNQTWPWPFVEYLIQCFDLNECEADDLSDRAQGFLDTGMAQDAINRGQVVGRLWVEAEVLAIQGSSMQSTWDTVEKELRS